MKHLLSSNKPDDIATLAYICGYPLVRAEVKKDYMTNPRVSGFGPVNQFHPVTELVNASFKEVVRPIAYTLYDRAWLDLKQGPLGNISLSFCSQCAFGICV